MANEQSRVLTLVFTDLADSTDGTTSCHTTKRTKDTKNFLAGFTG